MGVLQRLPLIVGQGFAREMAYTAGNYSALQAEKMGLVNDVYRGSKMLLTTAAQQVGRADSRKCSPCHSVHKRGSQLQPLYKR